MRKQPENENQIRVTTGDGLINLYKFKNKVNATSAYWQFELQKEDYRQMIGANNSY